MAVLLSNVTQDNLSESSSDSADHHPDPAGPRGYRSLLDSKSAHFSESVNLDHISERSSETEVPMMDVDNQITLSWQNLAVKSVPRNGRGLCCGWKRKQPRDGSKRNKPRQILKEGSRLSSSSFLDGFSISIDLFKRTNHCPQKHLHLYIFLEKYRLSTIRLCRNYHIKLWVCEFCMLNKVHTCQNKNRTVGRGPGGP